MSHEVVSLKSPLNTYAPYEPKRLNRWLVKFPKEFEISEWVLDNTSRPKITLLNDIEHISPIKIVLRDPIGPSTTQKLMNLLRTHQGFDYDLELLDPTGEIVERWTISGCQIKEIDFGELDYSIDGIAKIIMIVKPSKVELHF